MTGERLPDERLLGLAKRGSVLDLAADVILFSRSQIGDHWTGTGVHLARMSSTLTRI